MNTQNTAELKIGLCRPDTGMLSAMRLFVAALAQELEIMHSLCPGCVRLAPRSLGAWVGTHAAGDLFLMKSGIGPKTAAAKLQRFLQSHKVTEILVFGYAGAMEPDMRVGDLFAVRRVISIGQNAATGTLLDRMEYDGQWELADIDLTEKQRNQTIHRGDLITSPWIIGTPEQKRILRERFGAGAVDMETAAFAQVAATAGIPCRAVRAITDTADDQLLAPVTYDPTLTLAGRTKGLILAGKWVHRYREWTDRTVVARESLRQFLAGYLTNS